VPPLRPQACARTNTVTATIPVGAFPDGAAVDPTTKTIYVANSEDNTVSLISARTNTVTATIPVGTSASPSGVAVNPKANTAYVANFLNSTVSVLAPCPT
jgi:YVTN family beta-propeller protein